MLNIYMQMNKTHPLYIHTNYWLSYDLSMGASSTMISLNGPISKIWKSIIQQYLIYQELEIQFMLYAGHCQALLVHSSYADYSSTYGLTLLLSIFLLQGDDH